MLLVIKLLILNLYFKEKNLYYISNEYFIFRNSELECGRLPPSHVPSWAVDGRAQPLSKLAINLKQVV